MLPLPNLVIAGVVKAGTTSVFTYLSQHPEICGSSVKEAQYFSGYRYGKTIKPIDTYRKLFSNWKGEKFTLEATPGYFEGGEFLAEKIRNTVNEDIKILIILREPVDRLLSFFKYKKSILKLNKELGLGEYISQCENMSYDERCKQGNDTYWGIDGGFYSNHLPGWFEVFGDAVKVMFFDSLKEDRRDFMADLCNWLDIDDSIYDSLNLEIENKSQNYRSKHLQSLALTINQKMEVFFRRLPHLKHTMRNLYVLLNNNAYNERYPEETLDHIRSIYHPYNVQLAAILEAHNCTKLPGWLSGVD